MEGVYVLVRVVGKGRKMILMGVFKVLHGLLIFHFSSLNISSSLYIISQLFGSLIEVDFLNVIVSALTQKASIGGSWRAYETRVREGERGVSVRFSVFCDTIVVRDEKMSRASPHPLSYCRGKE